MLRCAHRGAGQRVSPLRIQASVWATDRPRGDGGGVCDWRNVRRATIAMFAKRRVLRPLPA